MVKIEDLRRRFRDVEYADDQEAMAGQTATIVAYVDEAIDRIDALIDKIEALRGATNAHDA